MNLSLRYDYVADATKSPIAYIERIYVKAEYRKQNVGSALIQYTQQWTLEQRCVEVASDALIENSGSQAFHPKIGF